MIHISNDELKKVLVEPGFVDGKQFSEAITHAKNKGGTVIDALLELGLIAEEALYQMVADYYKLPYLELKKSKIPPETLSLIDEFDATSQHLVPVSKKGNVIQVAIDDPVNIEGIRYVEQKTGLQVEPVLVTPHALQDSLALYKGSVTKEFAKIIEESIKESEGKEGDAAELAQDLPIIRILDTMLEFAAAQGASDIHIEPLEDSVLVRYRIDGLLRDVITLPKQTHVAIIARIKILSNLKIDETRLPQDGRFNFMLDEQRVAVRVSVAPVFYGEKVVMRLLNESQRVLTLEELGVSARGAEMIREQTSKAHGMILSTGPTNSGKTTTLYTVLHMLNDSTVNISTIEDPIEYDIRRINQIQVNTKIELTFASGLRSLLRQDPDVIMVGEIRDEETADLAVNAALTGHLVLSTLHTNDAAGAIPRLIDMGIEPFLLASTVNLVIAQRLVRRICSMCVQQIKVTPEMIKSMKVSLGIHEDDKNFKPPLQIYEGKGCEECHGTGYRGQVGIFELMNVDVTINDLILKVVDAQTIREQAKKNGMITLLQDGMDKVQAGTTTIEEVIRVIKE